MGKVWTIGLFGSTKSGKTILGESMLYKTGMITRMGDINQGNTTFDFDDEEKTRLISINLTTGYIKKGDNIIYLLDVPGYIDFVGEQISGIEVSDVAILNISSVEGIEVGTEKIWEMISKKNLPTIIFVNKLDVPEVDIKKVINEFFSFFKNKVILINYPVFENGKFNGVKDIFENEDLSNSEFGEFFHKSMDTLAELDDSIMEKYLEGAKLTKEEITNSLKKGIIERRVFPVLFGSALNQLGIEELIDFILNFVPSTDELPPLKSKNQDDQELLIERKETQPFTGIIFKTIFDPFTGRLSYIKVLSGKMFSNSQFLNSTKGIKERVGQLFRMQGRKQEPVEVVYPGEIVTAAKLNSQTFDTICDLNSSIIFEKPHIPEGAVSYSIAPKIKGTEDKLGNAIGRIAEEDLTIRIFRDEETGETIISGMGDLHIDITVNKFKNKFGVEVEKGIPKIAYKETITATTEAEGKFKRQTGGRGQYGHCFIRVEPLPRGGGFEFVDKIVGGAIPRNFIPSVEKGVRDAMKKGILANYPIVDIRVILYDGSYHVVDSSDIAFQIAGSMALQKAVANAKPILLEPIVNVEIRVPSENVGDVIGTINSKRGKVLDMTTSGNFQIVKAQVPLAEMSNYTNELRSLTSGKGTYSMEFSHYEEVPSHIASKIIEQRKKEKGGES
ncbi:MAG: elongation factor G [Candidatus Omnitrophica bacterium]|nr:elongation factor G [Candidatus Omnitrophota bacterium]MCM8802533.1 elongation factor G [Candidatus Omnitrophota bacterium]